MTDDKEQTIFSLLSSVFCFLTSVSTYFQVIFGGLRWGRRKYFALG